MKPTKRPRTMQAIYDFCLLDATFRFGFNIPEYHKCTPAQRKYYHKDFGKNRVSRSGTYYPIQREKQLHRFMGIKKWDDQYHRFFIHSETFETVLRRDHEIWELIYIISEITSNGVYIKYTHPFNHNRWIGFRCRSHRPYNESSCRLEVIEHMNKHLLFPAGRFRDLQVEHKVIKEEFINWYKEYKIRQAYQEEQDYWDMVERYSRPDPSITFDESMGILGAFDVFYVAGADDPFEKDQLAEEFMNLCNR